MDKAAIQDILRSREAVVTFTKKDGTQRVMRCTLKEDLIPQQHRPKTDNSTQRKANDTVIPVFDTEKEGWRSFTIDSIVSVV